MSAEAVLSATQSLICRHQPRAVARGDLIKAVYALDKGTIQFFYDLATQAGHGLQAVLARAIGATIQYAAVQVTDDLADDEGDYIECFKRTAPGVCWGLQHLFVLACRHADLPFEVLVSVSAQLLAMLEGQQRDVRTSRWTAEDSRAAAGMNERQFAAYFALLLHGTAFEASALTHGSSFGLALHVFGDLRSADPRLATLSPAGRRSMIESAQARLLMLASPPLSCLQRHAEFFDEHLRKFAACEETVANEL